MIIQVRSTAHKFQTTLNHFGSQMKKILSQHKLLLLTCCKYCKKLTFSRSLCCSVAVNRLVRRAHVHGVVAVTGSLPWRRAWTALLFRGEVRQVIHVRPEVVRHVPIGRDLHTAICKIKKYHSHKSSKK